jgi:2'-5' RNA ligase
LIRLVRLPERGHARLIAAEADQPAALMEMQRRLAHRLARNPREKAGERFLPHFTLARFTCPTRFDIKDEDAPLSCEPFTVHSVFLMKSALTPEGARHDVVNEFAMQ